MHDVHDWWMKGIVAGTLRGSCRVALEDEVLADKARIDAWIEPDPMRLGTLDARGLIGRMAKRAGSIETTWGSLSANTLDDHLQKVIIKHQEQRKLAEELRKKGLSYGVPVRPTSWTIGTGLSKTLLAEWGLAPMDRAHWPDGVYWGGGPYTPHVVIASLLPATRDTMLVRLMAGGKTFVRAMRDLLALASTEWEWEVVDPILRKLKGDLARLGLDVYDQEDEDAKMTAAEIYELFDEYDRQKHEQQEALRRMRESVMQARVEELARPLTDVERTRFETMTAAEIYELFDEYDRQKHEQQEALRRMREQRETVAHLLARLFSQKLKRDLTEDERQTLRRRIETLGSERVGDVVLAFDRDALGAWLAQPDAG